MNPQNVDRDYHVKVLAKRLLRIGNDMSAEALNANSRAEFVTVNLAL